MICAYVLLLLAALLPGTLHAQTGISFQAGDGGWQLASPVIGNIDTDLNLEIVTAYRNSSGVWVLDAHKPDGTRVAGFPYQAAGSPINPSPTLADLDFDGHNEIIFTCGSSITALRGNGSVFWKHTITPANYLPNAGFQVVTNGFYLSQLGPLQKTLPVTAEFSSEVSPPIVTDLECDGTLEVITGWKINPDKLGVLQDFNPFINDTFGLTEWGATGESWSGGVVISDAQTGKAKFIYHFHQLVESGLAIAQLDEDAALEILVLNDSDSVVAFDVTQPHGFFGKGMLHRKFGKNLRLLSGSYRTGVDLEVADIDGDGLDEVLVASSQINPNWQPSETILDDEGAILWREWKQATPVQNVHGWFNSAVLIPINPDNDNRIDVLGFTQSSQLTFRYWNGIELTNHPGWPKDFAPHFPSPPVVGDIDGDNIQEIVVGTYDPARNPSTGKLLVFSLEGTEKFAIDIPGGLKHIPALVDLDGNGRSEVVLRSLSGKIHVLKFGSGGTGPTSWAMHRGNASHRKHDPLYPVGTPIITLKAGAFERAHFAWRIPPGLQPYGFKIVRAESVAGPFREIGALDSQARNFIATGLQLGRQYVFEVHALYTNATVRSAPFAVLSDLNNNLVANGGFEQDDDSHWDKWFSGEIPWTDISGSSVNPQGGFRSMQIRLQNKPSGSSITQYSHYGIPEDYLPVTPGVLYSFGGFIRTSGFLQDSRHWFEWDSSKTAFNPNPRPPLPWPNYFTPSLSSASGRAWSYLNRVFEMPAGFSNVELRHRYQTSAAATGTVFLDNVFFRPLPPPNDSQWTQWISFQSSWRYLASTPPENWFVPLFDDSNWPAGTAKFGHGTGPQSIVTPLPKNQPAYYFRKAFYGSPGAHELLLATTCTDDYGGTVYPMRLWINGAEIPASGIEAVSGDGNIVKYFDLAPFTHLVLPGANVIAVALANAWQPTWDNVAFDLSLRAIAQPVSTEPTASIEIIERSPDRGVTLHLAADSASTWRLEHSFDVEANWTLLQEVNFQTGGVIVFPLPANSRSGFYRLTSGR